MNNSQKIHNENDAEAQSKNILEKHYGNAWSNIKKLPSGNHSMVYSFEYKNEARILRINPNEDGFKKDAMVHKLLQGCDIPVPLIFHNGNYADNLYYSISAKISGETVRDQYKRNTYSSFEKQFSSIDTIARTPLSPDQSGYGDWITDFRGADSSLANYIHRLYPSKKVIAWETVRKVPFFREDFIRNLNDKLEKYIPYSANVRELVHGDFGNDNVFMDSGEIIGIIDWEKSYYGDKFYDVGRVILYCPDRIASTQAVVKYYDEKDEPNYKERILAGVYYAMINNYAAAALANMKDSCGNSKSRIEEIENLFAL